MEIRIIHNLFYRKNNKLFINVDGLLFDDAGDYHEITDHQVADDDFLKEHLPKNEGIRTIAIEQGFIEVIYENMSEYLNYVMRGGN